MLSLRSVAYVTLLTYSLALLVPTHSARADLDQEEEADAPLPWRVGPAQISLGHHIELALPSGYQFLGLPHAESVMTQLGNLYNENLLGVVVSSEQDAEPVDDDGFLITLRYDEEGHIPDDEKLDGAGILQTIRDAEASYNQTRKQSGFPPVHAEGWQEPPRYDRARHALIWALLVSSADDEPGSDRTVNYSTRVLGRKGYVSVSLVTDARLLAKHKPAALDILAATHFNEGARYEDFDATSDAVAEFGLTGLVLGGVGLGVAKLAKVGLLAKLGKVVLSALIAGRKAIALLLVLGVAGARRFWNRRKHERHEQL